MEDNQQVDFIEVDVQPADFEWFSYCVRTCRLDLKIVGGAFRVHYEDAEDLYRLGLLVARGGNKDFLSNRCSLPVSLDADPPKPKKGRKNK
jgi:hypothetical protein